LDTSFFNNRNIMKNLDAAIGLAEKLGHVFVATADSSGMPHVAAAAQLNKISDNHVAVSAWFCPGTVANLDDNHCISLVVWDPLSDQGFQILGAVENIAEQAMMNGYSPDGELEAPIPQVERKLQVRVDKILAFSHAPHSDLDLS
jgi:hypothetical protein